MEKNTNTYENIKAKPRVSALSLQPLAVKSDIRKTT